MQLYDNCRSKLKWVYVSMSILKHYQPGYQSDLISNSEFLEIDKLEPKMEKEYLLK